MANNDSGLSFFFGFLGWSLIIGLYIILITYTNGCAAREHKEWKEKVAIDKASLEEHGWYRAGEKHWLKEVDGGHLHRQPDGDIIFIPTGWKAPE